MKEENHLEKNKLDLQYSNLLNWRSIIFGSYFAILAIIGTYLVSIFQGNMILFSASMMYFGFFTWIALDRIKYKEINERLSSIEKRIEQMD